MCFRNTHNPTAEAYMLGFLVPYSWVECAVYMVYNPYLFLNILSVLLFLPKHALTDGGPL